MARIWFADPQHALSCRVWTEEVCDCRLSVALSTAELLDLIAADTVPLVQVEENREAS